MGVATSENGAIPALARWGMDGAPRYLIGKDEDSNVYTIRTASPYVIVRFAAPSQAPNPTRAFVWPFSSLGSEEESQFLVAEHYRHFSKTIFQITAEKTAFEIVPFSVGADRRAGEAELEFLPKYVVCTPALNQGSHWALAPEYGVLWEVPPDSSPEARFSRELKLWDSGRALPTELMSGALHAAARIR